MARRCRGLIFSQITAFRVNVGNWGESRQLALAERSTAEKTSFRAEISPWNFSGGPRIIEVCCSARRRDRAVLQNFSAAVPPNRSFMSLSDIAADALSIERRHDGAVLVRVRSRERNGSRPPDAVFAFRVGDPQFRYWDERLRASETRDKS
jgi:hypothetical protein